MYKNIIHYFRCFSSQANDIVDAPLWVVVLVQQHQQLQYDDLYLAVATAVAPADAQQTGEG